MTVCTVNFGNAETNSSHKHMRLRFGHRGYAQLPFAFSMSLIQRSQCAFFHTALAKHSKSLALVQILPNYDLDNCLH
jgi:hypothetical protein